MRSLKIFRIIFLYPNRKFQILRLSPKADFWLHMQALLVLSGALQHKLVINRTKKVNNDFIQIFERVLASS